MGYRDFFRKIWGWLSSGQASAVGGPLCGTVTLSPRLAGTASLACRLTGAVTLTPRLTGTVTLEVC